MYLAHAVVHLRSWQDRNKLVIFLSLASSSRHTTREKKPLSPLSQDPPYLIDACVPNASLPHFLSSLLGSGWWKPQLV